MTLEWASESNMDLVVSIYQRTTEMHFSMCPKTPSPTGNISNPESYFTSRLFIWLTCQQPCAPERPRLIVNLKLRFKISVGGRDTFCLQRSQPLTVTQHNSRVIARRFPSRVLVYQPIKTKRRGLRSNLRMQILSSLYSGQVILDPTHLTSAVPSLSPSPGASLWQNHIQISFFEPEEETARNSREKSVSKW